MLNLPGVTLVAVDNVAHELCNLAIESTLKQVSFHDVIVFTNDMSKFAKGYRVFKADPKSMYEVAQILWRAVPPRIMTSHYLVIQWDGWVINPKSWTDEFLDYDYVGAPWFWHDNCRVGNGGFSLRSQKLGRFVAAHHDKYLTSKFINEDELICRQHRDSLQFYGFKWPHEELASKFSVEHSEGTSRPFGFHDCRNWPRFLGRAETLKRLSPNYITPYLQNKTEFNQLREFMRSLELEGV